MGTNVFVCMQYAVCTMHFSNKNTRLIFKCKFHSRKTVKQFCHKKNLSNELLIENQEIPANTLQKTKQNPLNRIENIMVISCNS